MKSKWPRSSQRPGQDRADKELALKEMELQAQAQVHTDPTNNLHLPNIDAQSPKLPASVDEKDEAES